MAKRARRKTLFKFYLNNKRIIFSSKIFSLIIGKSDTHLAAINFFFGFGINLQKIKLAHTVLILSASFFPFPHNKIIFLKRLPFPASFRTRRLIGFSVKAESRRLCLVIQNQTFPFLFLNKIFCFFK